MRLMLPGCIRTVRLEPLLQGSFPLPGISSPVCRGTTARRLVASWLACAAAATVVHTSAFGQIPDIVSAVMRAQYGPSKHASAGCWVHGTADLGRYCMKPVQQQVVATQDGSRVYILAEGLPINGDGAIQEIGAHAAPGLVGAFAVALTESGAGASPMWRLIAASKDLRLGSFGRAGASAAKFIRLGPSDYYGWTFVTGGTWQGISVGSHVILAPLGARFANLSTIPSMTEDDQQHSFDIAVDDTVEHVKVYPLVVTRSRVGEAKITGPAAQPKTVPFDDRRWRYAWPASQ